MPEEFDCLIIGGGPAGMTAAIYLARFRLSVLVIDDGNSRARQIACTNNHAGFPEGIAGADLLERMRDQARKYGARHLQSRVGEVTICRSRFMASSLVAVIPARTVLLATGVTNRRPEMPEQLHVAALREGRLRYCPICDAYEVIDRDVVVIGRSPHAVAECVFIRSFTARVTLILKDDTELSKHDTDRLRSTGIRVIRGQPKDFALVRDGIEFSVQETRMSFETAYAALGSQVHSSLAASLGAELTDEGCIKVDAHQRTSVQGLYAAGDVVAGLDQISHAMGEAAVAATAIRNDLAAVAPIIR